MRGLRSMMSKLSWKMWGLLAKREEIASKLCFHSIDEKIAGGGGGGGWTRRSLSKSTGCVFYCMK